MSAVVFKPAGALSGNTPKKAMSSQVCTPAQTRWRGICHALPHTLLPVVRCIGISQSKSPTRDPAIRRQPAVCDVSAGRNKAAI